MGALEANLAVAAAILLTGLSTLLALVAGAAFKRIGHGRLLWIALAFAGFAAKGAWAIQWTLNHRLDWGMVGWLVLVDLAIVLALYLAVLRD